MVRLLPKCPPPVRDAVPLFQSHNGAIAAGSEIMKAFCFVGFNPTMVRLLPNSQVASFLGENEFQSHNGAIAACRLLLRVAIYVKFQSHNGAIAAQVFGNLTPYRFSFNPTMVRLLRRCDICDNHSRLWFQSHNGAIAAIDEFRGRGEA